MLSNTSVKLWKRLSEISRLEFTSICRQIPPSFERREGTGEVIIQEADIEAITFFEKGKWRGVQSQTEIGFTNIFRWRLDQEKGGLSLEHLRFGANNPVFLFHLVPIEEHLLKSLEPHECKEDTYFASVLFDDHYIQLNWRIIGPKKNEIMCMVYS